MTRHHSPSYQGVCVMVRNHWPMTTIDECAAHSQICGRGRASCVRAASAVDPEVAFCTRRMPTVRPIASFALSLLVAIECWMSVASASVRAVANETGIGVSVDADGSFEVTTRIPAWKFSGNVGSPLAHLASRRGRDRVGHYREVNSNMRHRWQPRASAQYASMIIARSSFSSWSS